MSWLLRGLGELTLAVLGWAAGMILLGLLAIPVLAVIYLFVLLAGG